MMWWLILPIVLLVALTATHLLFNGYCDPIDDNECENCPYRDGCKFKPEDINDDV